MEFGRREARFMINSGTPLRRLGEDELVRAKVHRSRYFTQFYELEEDCGNLNPETSMCEAYEDRPNPCRDFEPGTKICESMLARYDGTTVSLGMPAVRATLQIEASYDL